MADTELVARNLAVARRISEEWATLTRDEWHELLAPDCDYRNIPIEGDRHIGPDAVFEVIEPFGARWRIEVEMVTIAGDESVVLTERVERFIHKAGKRPTFDLPVMGAFELRDGKVTAWRDYFELSQRKLR